MRRRLDPDELQSELLRRMAEPEHLRKLRRQKERIDAEREAALQKMQHDSEAEHLRREIAAAGHRPEA